MNNDVIWQGKRNKRLNVEELKTDYSGVYLQNEKLEQALKRFIEKLQKDRKRLKEQHELELYQLQKEVESMNIFLQSSNSFKLFNQPLTGGSTIRIPVPQRPDLNRDPTTFPETWFTSVYVPTDKELNRIKRQRFAHPPLPFIRRSKTDVVKKKATNEFITNEDEDHSFSVSDKTSKGKQFKQNEVVSRSKTEINNKNLPTPTFGQSVSEQPIREPSSVSLSKSTQGSASIYAGRSREPSVFKEHGAILLDFMAQRTREASGRSRLHSQGSSRFAERGREPSGRSIARSLGKPDIAELKLPQLVKSDAEESQPAIQPPAAAVVTRSVRELRAMARNSQADKLPNKETLRKQRMLESTQRKIDRIEQKMKLFLRSIQDEMEQKDEDNRPKLVEFVF